MKYVCMVCGYIYDEEKEKVKFEDLPEDWTCPFCGAPKSVFKLMEKEEENESKKEEKIIENIEINENDEIDEIDEDMVNLSIGQLSTLCSNLARGCEKQYKLEEEKQFKEIAKYLEKITPKEENSTIDGLMECIKEDLSINYQNANKIANEKDDRGAKRACLWSEKVTKMIDSLLNTYQKQGEEMFNGKEIWICTVCGFIYVGNKLPERCPVCKVPNNKFKKIDGRAQI